MSNIIQETYPWITDSFILENLRKIEKDAEITLNSFDIRDALEKGENFCSSIFRISVKYEVNVNNNLDDKLKKEKSFILKTEIQNDEFDSISNQLNLFAREITAYERILPRVQQLLKTIGDDDTRFAPM